MVLFQSKERGCEEIIPSCPGLTVPGHLENNCLPRTCLWRIISLDCRCWSVSQAIQQTGQQGGNLTEGFWVDHCGFTLSSSSHLSFKALGPHELPALFRPGFCAALTLFLTLVLRWSSSYANPLCSFIQSVIQPPFISPAMFQALF